MVHKMIQNVVAYFFSSSLGAYRGEIVILLFLILPIIRFLKLLRSFAACLTWRLNKCGLGSEWMPYAMWVNDGTDAT